MRIGLVQESFILISGFQIHISMRSTEVEKCDFAVFHGRIRQSFYFVIDFICNMFRTFFFTFTASFYVLPIFIIVICRNGENTPQILVKFAGFIHEQKYLIYRVEASALLLREQHVG